MSELQNGKITEGQGKSSIAPPFQSRAIIIFQNGRQSIISLLKLISGPTYLSRSCTYVIKTAVKTKQNVYTVGINKELIIALYIFSFGAKIANLLPSKFNMTNKPCMTFCSHLGKTIIYINALGSLT